MEDAEDMKTDTHLAYDNEPFRESLSFNRSFNKVPLDENYKATETLYTNPLAPRIQTTRPDIPPITMH